MKKYVMPAVEGLNLVQSEMLCVSGEVTIDPGTEVEGGFTPDWNADRWGNEEE